jgi:hypothetical protein
MATLPTKACRPLAATLEFGRRRVGIADSPLLLQATFAREGEAALSR